MGEAPHESVLKREVVDALSPALGEARGDRTGPRVFVDATAGAGGHTFELLRHVEPDLVVLIDRDRTALELARARLGGERGELRFVHDSFSHLDEILAREDLTAVDAILADLGVSSMQLDRPERGFSFRFDAPLDMRMNAESGPSAGDWLASASQQEIATVLWRFGEERDARRIAAAIASERPTRTHALRDLVERVVGHRGERGSRRIHPATKTFQALRIWVNQELQELERFLEVAPSCLATRGRLGIITFHSLEDRMVKRRFAELTKPQEVPRGLPIRESERARPAFVVPAGWSSGVTPSEEERATQPRSRSARLRLIERLTA